MLKIIPLLLFSIAAVKASVVKTEGGKTYKCDDQMKNCVEMPPPPPQPALPPNKLRSFKIEIVAPSEDTAIKTNAGGIPGIIAGTRTHEVVFFVNTIIEGDHARLKCFENHRGCTAVGPGVYDAEIRQKDGDVWINLTLPVSHKTVRDHWKVAGTW